MKCPLVREDVYRKGLKVGTAMSECGEELCAWWNERYGMCCVAVAAHITAEEEKLEEKLIERDLARRMG